MQAYMEAQCPKGHKFYILSVSRSTCPTCEWLFQVTPKTNKDFVDTTNEPPYLIFPRRKSRIFDEESEATS
jgi:hypothetical protein